MTGEEALAYVLAVNEAVRCFDHRAYINRRHGLSDIRGEKCNLIVIDEVVDNPQPVWFDISRVFRPADRVFVQRRRHPGVNRHIMITGPFLVADKTHEQLGQHRRPARGSSAGCGQGECPRQAEPRAEGTLGQGGREGRPPDQLPVRSPA